MVGAQENRVLSAREDSISARSMAELGPSKGLLRPWVVHALIELSQW